MKSLVGMISQIRNVSSLVWLPLLLVAVLVLWVGIIAPQQERLQQASAALHSQQQLADIVKGMAADIDLRQQAVARRGTDATASTQQPPLQTIEQFALEFKVSSLLTNVSPISVVRGGETYAAYALEFNEISMLELIPFVAALDKKSLLKLQDIRLQKADTRSGVIRARVVLADAS